MKVERPTANFKRLLHLTLLFDDIGIVGDLGRIDVTPCGDLNATGDVTLHLVRLMIRRRPVVADDKAKRKRYGSSDHDGTADAAPVTTCIPCH